MISENGGSICIATIIVLLSLAKLNQENMSKKSKPEDIMYFIRASFAVLSMIAYWGKVSILVDGILSVM
jgi:hypothetical protein